jgi:dipeptidase E
VLAASRNRRRVRSDRRRRLQHGLHSLHGGAHRQATAQAAVSAHGLGGFRHRHRELVSQLRALNVEPSAQESFIASTRQTRSWEEVFLSVDGIVCSGGNTLNQQAIWRAQGIDVILRQAWDRGIVLGGASAGSLCWFEEGTTDSRPKELTIVKCLGFLTGSHSPHYDAEKNRRPLYHKLIGSGEMKPGWACDNDAGIYFEDNEPKRFVATRDGAKSYYVSAEGGTVVEKPYTPERIT